VTKSGRGEMWSAMNPATVLTLTGLSFGLIATVAAIGGEIELGLIALVIAGICDLFDGRVARGLDLDERAKAFGVQIDSLADMASFGVAPAALVVAASQGSCTWLALAAAVPYAVCAAVRLAHFNVQGVVESDAGPYYQGLPVTYAALILPVAYVAARLAGEGWIAPVFVAALATCAALFVSSAPVRKPSGRLYVIFPLIALAVVGALLAWRLAAG
jgi:CDP-diacylglycerol---serine O-phosphatidyltransferase